MVGPVFLVHDAVHLALAEAVVVDVVEVGRRVGSELGQVAFFVFIFLEFRRFLHILERILQLSRVGAPKG